MRVLNAENLPCQEHGVLHTISLQAAQGDFLLAGKRRVWLPYGKAQGGVVCSAPLSKGWARSVCIGGGLPWGRRGRCTPSDGLQGPRLSEGAYCFSGLWCICRWWAHSQSVPSRSQTDKSSCSLSSCCEAVPLDYMGHEERPPVSLRRSTAASDLPLSGPRGHGSMEDGQEVR